MKKVMYLVLMLIFASCSSNEIDDLVIDKQAPKRIAFSSSSEMMDTYSKLSKMSSSEFDNWLLLNNPTFGLYSIDDEYLDEMPSVFKALFNSNREVQIADSVIWYNKGNMYVVAVGSDQSMIAKNKLNPSLYPIFGEAGVVSLEDDPNDSKLKASMGADGKTNSCQTDKFRFGDGRYEYKYVYELKAVCLKYTTYTRYEFWLYNKMEYRYSSWKRAGQTRIVSANIQGGVTGVVTAPRANNADISQSSFININVKNQETRYPYDDTPLLVFSHPNGWHTFHRWNYTINGTITQEVKDYPATRRTSSFSW